MSIYCGICVDVLRLTESKQDGSSPEHVSCYSTQVEQAHHDAVILLLEWVIHREVLGSPHGWCIHQPSCKIKFLINLNINFSSATFIFKYLFAVYCIIFFND